MAGGFKDHATTQLLLQIVGGIDVVVVITLHNLVGVKIISVVFNLSQEDSLKRKD